MVTLMLYFVFVSKGPSLAGTINSAVLPSPSTLPEAESNCFSTSFMYMALISTILVLRSEHIHAGFGRCPQQSLAVVWLSQLWL